jgi:hypothetical protein
MAIAAGGVLGVVVWSLAKVGNVLIKVAEALAAAVVVGLAIWLLIKAVWWALHQAVTRWRTSLTVLGVLAWRHWWGWPSLVITAVVVAGMLIGWWLLDVTSFDAWACRYLRHGGCAGRCMYRSCQSGCTPAAWASSQTPCRSW